MTHVMIDLETWGVNAGCAIRSIGAVAFDPLAGTRDEDFYINIADDSCEAYGLIREPETVAWWAEQSEEAQAALRTDQHRLVPALVAFAAWFKDLNAERIWSYGATSDIPWLEAAYRATKIDVPWTYRQPSCARTILALAGVEVDRTRGVFHNALHDAENQAYALIEAYKVLGLSGRTPLEHAKTAGAVLQQVCHAASRAAGWWDGVNPFGPGVFPTKLMLSVSELAEAMEGDRKGLMDTHLPHRPMAEVELADTVIRVADLAGSRGYDLGGAIAEKMAYNAVRQDHKAEVRAAAGGKAY